MTPGASGGNRLPRDAAGHLELNESFVAAVFDKVGSSNPVVARVLLQGLEILNGAVFDRSIDKKAITRELHAIKKALVACHKVAERVVSHFARVVDEGEKHGLPGDDGGSLNLFPQVPDLDADATTFLIHAKRAIRRISQLPSIFFSIPRDSDFDHLLKRLEKVTAAQGMMKFVRDNAPGIRYLSELRNCQEHPKKSCQTMIDNFKVLPNASVAVPMWYMSGETPRPVAVEMRGAIEFLIMMAEAMLIHLVMACVTKKFPFIVQPIEPVNPTNPIRYRISIDMGRGISLRRGRVKTLRKMDVRQARGGTGRHAWGLLHQGVEMCGGGMCSRSPLMRARNTGKRDWCKSSDRFAVSPGS